MMSIMNERIERKGEILLSAPVRTVSIIIGKALPYFIGMLAICAGLTLYIKASPIIIFPLIPVIFFFLANALLIGMLSRSFKELSFISIFFSTVATSYLFFPSIFANVHVISLISPLTLIVLSLQGTAWTVTDFLYSTSLFWLTSAVLFYIAAMNFREERLFSEKNLVTRLREFLSEVISKKRPFLSLFLLTGFMCLIFEISQKNKQLAGEVIERERLLNRVHNANKLESLGILAGGIVGQGGQIRLQPANSTMQPIYTTPENVEIQGKFISSFRPSD